MDRDGVALQEDLDSLVEWSNIWQLRFNPAKCKVMHVGHQCNTRYFIAGDTGRVEVESVLEERDLGVNFVQNLKPSSQCQKVAAKARRIIGMVRRNFRRLDKEDFLLIYKTYICPHLEYCIQAWSPHLTGDMQCLERIQKAATNLVPSLRGCSYEDRLRKLRLTTLQKRRSRGDMIEVFKIVTAREKVPMDQFFHLADNSHGLRGHTLKLVKERARLDIRKYFFSQRVVGVWNSLPQHVVDAVSVNAFKNALDRFWHNMDDIS